MLNINWGLVAKWRDELRSGKHKQTKHVLQDEDGSMCCLGVLEDKVCKTPKRLDELQTFIFIAAPNDAESGILTKSTTKKLGLNHNTNFGAPEFLGKGLVQLNDNDGLTFDEIADLLDIALIEKDYLA